MADSGVINVCVLGAGSVRCMPGVIGSLATYFGERPLEVRFWDADEERLDLFDRFARLCFGYSKSGHRLISTPDSKEALKEAWMVVLVMGENCARKRLSRKLAGTEEEVISAAVDSIVDEIEPDAEVLSLIDEAREGWKHLSWPEEPTEAERKAVPHQVLRYLHEDEYPHEFLKRYAKSPLKDWLNESMAVR